MKKNKIIDWVKNHKTIVICSMFGIGLGAVGIYYKNKIELETEGTSKWFKHATLDDLYKYRNKVQHSYMNAGVNGLNTLECDQLYYKLNYIDNKIADIKWGDNPRVLNIPAREHGWYLPEKD